MFSRRLILLDSSYHLTITHKRNKKRIAVHEVGGERARLVSSSVPPLPSDIFLCHVSANVPTNFSQ